MAKPYRIISFSPDPFDQWRLSEVKGVITVKDRTPAFQFDTKEQFERYLQLNSFRGRVGV
ncbi:hypothetical protein [Bacillus sonorensis]|uniref:hypothetical protein n=1 Tax=Bacillus sonorensis TaxID=119858 RepID=UPI00228215C0|nr:hypothetical protein [Bacillus sonorensis]MCY8269641.1 hypothetical protein [Bacillus sonorensis]MCY8606597.1 hypothetical protein [Bacillus sonorensis]